MNITESSKQKQWIVGAGTIMISIVSLFLGGCAHQNSGIRYYEPVTKATKDGHRYQKQELVASIATDMPGLKHLRVGALELEFSGEAMQTQEAVYDRKGNYVATLSQSYLPGMYPSHTIRAQGEATARVVDSAAAGVTGAVMSGGGATLLGGIPGAVSSASSVFTP